MSKFNDIYVHHKNSTLPYVDAGPRILPNARYFDYTNEMRAGARMGSVTMHDRIARGRVMSQPIARFGIITGMIETAENLGREYQIAREDADAFAAESHRRAQRAVGHSKICSKRSVFSGTSAAACG